MFEVQSKILSIFNAKIQTQVKHANNAFQKSHQEYFIPHIVQ